MSGSERRFAPLALRSSLDAHFDPAALARTLDIDDATAVHLAREALYPPLADALAGTGKQLRARLVAHAFAIARGAETSRVRGELPPELPLLVELLHAGSLVVDDIEDGAETRRGAPALHRAWGTPVALNAGNWLYFWPLARLAALPLDRDLTLEIYRRTCTVLLRCHHGQALDLGLRVDELPQTEVAAAVAGTTRLKTGGLLELACALGSLAAGAAPPVERALTRFGRELGAALQMFDDLGGVLAPSRAHKGREDVRAARATWPWAWLADALDPRVFRALQEAAGAARRGDGVEALLETLRAHVRPHAARPRAHLGAAFARLRERVGDLAPLAELARDAAALEPAYV